MLLCSVFLEAVGNIVLGGKHRVHSAGGAVAPLSPLISFRDSPQLSAIDPCAYAGPTAGALRALLFAVGIGGTMDRHIRLPWGIAKYGLCLPGDELRLIIALHTYLNSDTGLCCPSVKTLAEQCYTSEGAIRRARIMLKKRGWLVTTKVGRKTQYEFTPLFYSPNPVTVDWAHGRRIIKTAHPTNE